MTGRPFHYRTCEVIEKCVDQIVLVNVRTFHSYIYFIWGGVKILMGWQFRQKRQQSVVLSGKLQKNKNDRWYLMMCKATVGKFFFALSWNTKRKTIFNIRLRAVIFWGFMACFDLSLQENKTVGNGVMVDIVDELPLCRMANKSFSRSFSLATFHCWHKTN